MHGRIPVHFISLTVSARGLCKAADGDVSVRVADESECACNISHEFLYKKKNKETKKKLTK